MNDKVNINLDEYTRYKFLIENIKDNIWEIDLNFIYTYVSPTIKEMCGYEVDEVVGRSVFDFLTNESKTKMQELWSRIIHKRVNFGYMNSELYDMQVVCKNGEKIWCEVCSKPVFKDKELIGIIGTTRDITEKKILEHKVNIYLEELKLKNKQLEDLATLDMLTGVYNRRKFEYYIGLEIEKKEKYDSSFSIIMFDIDNFKSINDFYGHEKGDKILLDIIRIIRQTLRESDKIFRWGGDEFIILLPELALKNALKVADKVRKTIQSFNFNIEDKEVTVSLGVGNFALDENPDQLIARVDKALLMAKNHGKNMVELC